MEKISIRPKATEILIGNNSDTELSEVFSYDYSGLSGNSSGPMLASSRNPDEIARKLGSLYIVGHLSPKNDETSYIVSLISSLAKREYYANPDLGPKDSFSRALKKINETLEDFFKRKEHKVDIGVFAVANENIYISKLGKFKIFLYRNNENVDVLNNINLFTKDRAAEEEFSSVISGKVKEGDKILAYYPNRALTTRERYLKDYLAKLDSEGFIKKIKESKSGKTTVSMAGLYVNINKFVEPAVESKMIPAELKPKAQPAPTPAILTKNETKSIKISETEQTIAADLKVSQAADQAKDTLVLKPRYQGQQNYSSVPPMIIPSEFSSAGRRNPIMAGIQNITSLVGYAINPRVRSASAKITVLAIVGALVVGTAFGAKSLFFKSQEDKTVNALLENAEMNIDLARTKIGQNDIMGAREILASSLYAILNAPQDTSEKYNSVKNEISSQLDQLDNAGDATVSSVESLPKELADLGVATTGIIEKLNKGEYKVSGQVKSHFIYENNLYILTDAGIYRVPDAVKGSIQTSSWLKEGQTLPIDPLALLVDGNIYIITKSGFLNTFYKGERKSEIKIPIVPTEDTIAMATLEGSNIYLLDKKLGRVYQIDKKTGILAKTLKINNASPISSAVLAQDETLYITTQDSRIWSVR